MKSATIQLETLTCPSCMQKIEGAVKTVAGVDKERINITLNSSRVRLNFDAEQTSIEQIEDAITKVGYEVKKSRVK